MTQANLVKIISQLDVLEIEELQKLSQAIEVRLTVNYFQTRHKSIKLNKVNKNKVRLF